MQTILGAGGAIGNELAKALTDYTTDIRLVSRNPKAVNPNDQLFKADLTNKEEVDNAVKGSKVVYLTVGLPYSTKLWQANWPIIMRNVLDACITHQARLVFFDNIYMYDPDYFGHISEDNPVRPISKKGAVRKQVADMLMDEVNSGKLQALIARAADFYGPSIKNVSVLTEIVLNNLAGGRAANWLVDPEKKHSFTYTPDAGKATALLGNTPDAFGQVWHLPTAGNPLSGEELINTVSKEMGVKPRKRVISRAMLKLIGIFIPVMRESVEMLYQYDRDYIFSSEKFEKAFNFTPTPYERGIKEIVAADYSHSMN